MQLTKQKGIHSQAHALAYEFKKLYSEEPFGLFLGLIKQRGVQWAYTQLSEIKTYWHDKKEKRPIQFLMVNKL